MVGNEWKKMRCLTYYLIVQRLKCFYGWIIQLRKAFQKLFFLFQKIRFCSFFTKTLFVPFQPSKWFFLLYKLIHKIGHFCIEPKLKWIVSINSLAATASQAKKKTRNIQNELFICWCYRHWSPFNRRLISKNFLFVMSTEIFVF